MSDTDLAVILRTLLALHGATINLLGMMAEGTANEAAVLMLSDQHEAVCAALGVDR